MTAIDMGSPSQAHPTTKTPLQPQTRGNHRDVRLTALRRFAIAITLLNFLGYAFLGFEPPLAAPILALMTAYTLEITFEAISAWSTGRIPAFQGGVGKLTTFLLPAHITALAVSMLLFAGVRIWPIVFATAIAIASKAIIRINIKGRSRHILNPSNFGIAVALILLPGVGLAPPYQFTKNLLPPWEILVPFILVLPGIALNRLTGRLPVVFGWLGGFVVQAVLRVIVTDASVIATLAPITGMAFILFSFYMVTDPSTTPSHKGAQIAFGVSVALVYGLLTALHIAFAMFLSLVIVCCVRGIGLWATNSQKVRRG